MAGLAGIVAFDQSDGERSMELVERMCDLQAHRGPDDRNVVRLGNLTLGVTRLRINDLSPAGRQPLHDDREDLWVCLDGEIYNHHEIRQELMAKGRAFRTQTDTEVVLHAYEAWGEQCFDRFLGMFALVIHDRRTGTTTLVRDHFGMKPLHYLVRDQKVLFASEIKALLGVRPEQPRLNERALLEWALYGDVMPPETLFDGVMSVSPGHLIEIASGRATPVCRRYYSAGEHVNPSLYRDFATRPVTEVVDELDEALKQSTVECLSGDAPVGVALSGGVDSAFMTAIAARHKPVVAFHLSVPDDPRLDERRMAEDIARHLGVELLSHSISGEEFRRELAQVTYLNEMPLWHLQCVGFRMLALRAGETGVKALLSGEHLLGFSSSRHLVHRWLSRVRNGLTRLPDTISNPIQKAVLASKGITVTSPGLPRSMPLAVNMIDRCFRVRLLAECEGVYSFVNNPVHRAMHASRLADLTQWRHRFFHRADRLAMWSSIESRMPFMDVRSVHMAINLPLKIIMRTGNSKWALRQVALRYLPREFVFQKKVAWDLPARQYLGPLARTDLFKGGFFADSFGISGKSLDDLIANWRVDFQSFFNLVQLEIWGRLWILQQTVEEVTDLVAGLAADSRKVQPEEVKPW